MKRSLMSIVMVLSASLTLSAQTDDGSTAQSRQWRQPPRTITVATEDRRPKRSCISPAKNGR